MVCGRPRDRTVTPPGSCHGPDGRRNHDPVRGGFPRASGRYRNGPYGHGTLRGRHRRGTRQHGLSGRPFHQGRRRVPQSEQYPRPGSQAGKSAPYDPQSGTRARYPGHQPPAGRLRPAARTGRGGAGERPAGYRGHPDRTLGADRRTSFTPATRPGRRHHPHFPARRRRPFFRGRAESAPGPGRGQKSLSRRIRPHP